MIYTFRLARLALTMLILVAVVFIACQRQEQRADDGDIQISLQPVPTDEILVVILSDASGAPVTGATVALEGNMNHAGMIPVVAEATADEADGSADGRYHLPFTFTMLGDWIITVTVTQADGSTFSRNLDVRASQEGIEGENIVPAEGAAPADGDAHESTTDGTANNSHAQNHEATSGAHPAFIHVHDPMARPAPLAGGTGAVYFVIHNGGDTPVQLLNAESPASGAVEIHTTINDNGVMRMRQITGLELEPGESIQFTPGELHLMLVDLVAPLTEGDTVEVTLHFEGAGDLTFDAPVVAMDDLPAEGETAHDH